MSLKEIVSKIIDDTENSDIIEEMFDQYMSSSCNELLEKYNITATEVDHAGGEDEGRDYYTVYEFSDNIDKVFVKLQGWYASYQGSEYESYSFVEPKEKVVIVYE